MPSNTKLHLLEKQFIRIAANSKISKQLDEVRKLLSHFPSLVEYKDPQYDECYSSTLRYCEALIVRCDVADRNIDVLRKILNTILEIINRDYVNMSVVSESLATFYNIMGQLFHVEAKKLHEMLREKLPNVCKYFNAMENFGIMASIVGILHEYVFKYDLEERESVLLEILDGFYDSTGSLTQLLSWPRESFNTQCRKFLNDIPGRKYFSLSARVAIFGGRTIVPRRDYDYISFEWNMNPAELSFSSFSFEGERDKELEVSVDLQDITAIEIIRDCKDPRVICEYEKMTAAGVSVDSYQLKIYASDYRELAEVEKITSPLMKRNAPPSPRLTQIESTCDEVIIRHEKLYTSTDFINHTLTNENRVTEDAMQRDTTPKESMQSMVHNEEISKENMDPMAHNENAPEENVDVEEADTKFKPFDMEWKANLMKSSTKNKPSMYDPYDIAHMQEDEKELRKEKPQLRVVVKRANAKKGANVANGNHPKGAKCITTTPKITSTPRVVDSQSRLMDMDDLSSIGQNSSHERMVSEGSDESYVPYTRLSKTPPRSRGNQKGKKRQRDAARAPRKRTNAKKNEPMKNGTGKGTAPTGGKKQQWGILSGAPSAPSTPQMDVAVNDGSCQAMDTSLSKPESFAKRNTRKTSFLCERLNAKKTTTHTTTKVTTTETTEVGIGACTEAGHRPKGEMATLEDVSMTTSIEPVPVQAMQKVYTSLYKVEKHQEYRVNREVNNELDCCCVRNTLSEGERAHVLAHVDKIREILSRNRPKRKERFRGRSFEPPRTRTYGGV